MKTEEDTFRRLQRISYEEMREISKNIILEFLQGHSVGMFEGELIPYEKYGWTKEEYMAEYARRHKNSRSNLDLTS